MSAHRVSGRDGFCEDCWQRAKELHAGVGAAAAATYDTTYLRHHGKRPCRAGVVVNETRDARSSASRQHFIDTGEYLPASDRADTVNGVDVSGRQACAPGEHQVAAFHGYCLICGTDGWEAATRRATLSAQRQVSR